MAAGVIAGLIAELAIALVSIVISSVDAENKSKAADARSSRETQLRAYYEAAANRFGVTKQEIDQYLDKLNLNLNQLSESARGSARLSRASQIVREFMAFYPQEVNKINQVKATIDKEVSQLRTKEEEKASRVQNRKDVSNQEVLSDVSQAVRNVNDATGSLGKPEQLEEPIRSTTIDTKLNSKEIDNGSKQSNNSSGKPSVIKTTVPVIKTI